MSSERRQHSLASIAGVHASPVACDQAYHNVRSFIANAHDKPQKRSLIQHCRYLMLCQAKNRCWQCLWELHNDATWCNDHLRALLGVDLSIMTETDDAGTRQYPISAALAVHEQMDEQLRDLIRCTQQACHHDTNEATCTRQQNTEVQELLQTCQKHYQDTKNEVKTLYEQRHTLNIIPGAIHASPGFRHVDLKLDLHIHHVVDDSVITFTPTLFAASAKFGGCYGVQAKQRVFNN